MEKDLRHAFPWVHIRHSCSMNRVQGRNEEVQFGSVLTGSMERASWESFCHLIFPIRRTMSPIRREDIHGVSGVDFVNRKQEIAYCHNIGRCPGLSSVMLREGTSRLRLLRYVKDHGAQNPGSSFGKRVATQVHENKEDNLEDTGVDTYDNQSIAGVTNTCLSSSRSPILPRYPGSPSFEKRSTKL